MNCELSQLYGLVGYPLGHSFSRVFFCEKFARENIDADYLNFEIADITDLRHIIAAHPTLCGLNVTIPHKQDVIPLIDELHPDAETIGAVNTIKIIRSTGKADARLVGYNTDCIGFEDSLTPLLQPHHHQALVLGTGGASRAIVYVLRKLGIAPTYVSRLLTNTATDIPMVRYDDLTPDIISTHHLIVNCTPVGMYPHIDQAPSLPYHLLTPQHLLYDLVYNPTTTRFMQLGTERGATVKNGLEMLECQALASLRYWNS